jgi:hypothetical protein
MARKNVKKQFDAKAADAKQKTDKIDTVYVGEHGKMCRLYPTKWIEKKCSVWCINEGSIQSIRRSEEYFSKGMKKYDRKQLN